MLLYRKGSDKSMSRSKLIHSEQFNFKISPELRQELEILFGKKNLSGKVREYLVGKITKDKKKNLFPEETRKLSKLDELIEILGLSGDTGKRQIQRYRKQFKAFSDICKKTFEHSEYYCQVAKRTLLIYDFDLQSPYPEDKALDSVIEYLEKEK